MSTQIHDSPISASELTISDPAPYAETLATSVVILLLMTVAQRIIGFGRGILFCRWLPPEDLGQWDVAFAFLNLAGPLVVLGLPGSFGRYLEHYRQRGQFHSFLRRTALVSGIATAIAVCAIVLGRNWFSNLIFGDDVESSLVTWLAVCLATVILHNFLTSLFIALRMYRVVTLLQFLQGLGFAVLSLTLLTLWSRGPESVIVGYAAATFVASLASIAWLMQLTRVEESTETWMPHGAFWSRLVPFAIWMWVTNLIANLFDLADRYMIVHHGGMSSTEALRQVGYYHASRIIPLLFVGVAALLASMITPHLTTDWELGRRESVVRRLNFVIKLLSIVLLSASSAVLFIAPTLFDLGFHNKFAGGLEVLPCTLTYCAWFGVFAVAQNYLWCAERAALSNLPLLAGLILNVGFNIVLLPRYGLPGAVWATTLANFAAVVLAFFLSGRFGMTVDLGTWIFTLAIGSVCFGPWVSLFTTLCVVILSFSSDHFLLREEKRELLDAFSKGLKSIRRLPNRLFTSPVLQDN